MASGSSNHLHHRKYQNPIVPQRKKNFKMVFNIAFMNKYCTQYYIYQCSFYMASSIGISWFLLISTILTFTGNSWSCHICGAARYGNVDLKMCTMFCKNLINSVLC